MKERWFVDVLGHQNTLEALTSLLASEGRIAEAPAHIMCDGMEHAVFEVERRHVELLNRSEHKDKFLAFHKKGGGQYFLWPFAGRGRSRPQKRLAKKELRAMQRRAGKA